MSYGCEGTSCRFLKQRRFLFFLLLTSVTLFAFSTFFMPKKVYEQIENFSTGNTVLFLLPVFILIFFSFPALERDLKVRFMGMLRRRYSVELMLLLTFLSLLLAPFNGELIASFLPSKGLHLGLRILIMEVLVLIILVSFAGIFIRAKDLLRFKDIEERTGEWGEHYTRKRVLIAKTFFILTFSLLFLLVLTLLILPLTIKEEKLIEYKRIITEHKGRIVTSCFYILDSISLLLFFFALPPIAYQLRRRDYKANPVLKGLIILLLYSFSITPLKRWDFLPYSDNISDLSPGFLLLFATFSYLVFLVCAIDFVVRYQELLLKEKSSKINKV